MSIGPDSTAPRMSGSLIDFFAGTFEHPTPPRLYQAGLGIAALAMILLPVIYLAVIAAAGWLVCLQATQGLYFGSGLWAVISYLTPIVAGSIVVFFMLKPLLARPARQPDPRVLEPAEEPLLHMFVERICDLVGSPKPREIRVDCQVNASAAFRRGLSSLGGKDLVLTIGLPLAAGLRADQLAGVLAHEFGHFSQSVGMRLSYLVRSISAWFHRVVYERDEWDMRLERWARDADWRVVIALHAARFGVWISRKILHGLMMAGLGVSSFLLRQMEFDADLYETRLAGSKTFAETSLEIELLGTAQRQALSEIADLWGRVGWSTTFPA